MAEAEARVTAFGWLGKCLFMVSVTVTPIGTRLERGAWGVRDVPRYGQPNHDFETGRTRSCAQHG
jgi:hypothetical protein